MPFIPACFAVAALCSPIQVYSIELATPNDEALISPVVSTEDDSIEADGAFEKDSLGSTGDAGDITPDDAQTPAVGEDEAGVPSPVSDVPAEPSTLPSNPQSGGIAIYSMLADGSFALMDSDNGLVLGNGGGDSWRFDTTIAFEQPYADANGAQRRLVNIACSTPTPGANLCSAWISRV